MNKTGFDEKLISTKPIYTIYALGKWFLLFKTQVFKVGKNLRNSSAGRVKPK